MRLIACAVAVLSGFITTDASAAEDSLKSQLLRLERERQSAFIAGDQTVLESQFADEYVETNHHGGRTSRAEELDFYKPGVFSLEDGAISDVTVHRYGDIATLIGTIEWKDATYRPNPNAGVDLSGRFAVSRVYIWRDGRWQLALSHASRLP